MAYPSVLVESILNVTGFRSDFADVFDDELVRFGRCIGDDSDEGKADGG